MDWRSRGPAQAHWLGLWCLCAVGATVADAQVRAAPALVAEGEKAKDENLTAAQSIFPPVDRQLLLALSKARQLTGDGRYAEAVRYLGTILDAPEDYFDCSSESALASQVFPSLKGEAQALLGQMPSQGRELYELQFGARAQQMLKAAVTAGDAAGLAELSRRFFHTRAGYEATLLLGLHYLDCGSPLAAALTLQRVRDACPVADQFEPGLSVATAACWLRAGQPETARAVLDKARQRNPRAVLQIGGTEVALSAEAARLIAPRGPAASAQPEAEQCLVYRGNAARNASTASSGPLLSTVWRVPTTDHPYVEALIDEVQQSFREQDQWAIPASHPLVVNNLVLMRTASNLLAVDLVTGKRLWEVPTEDPFEALLDPPGDSPMSGYMVGMPLDPSVAVRYRLWGDSTFGTLSSDGQYVFAIEDLSLDLWAWANRWAFGPARRGGPLDAKPYNRLAAYDIRTGKLTWHLGGSPEELGLPQAGTFFLGPPLPFEGQLYVLGELKGGIQLLCLDAKTGSVAWPQQLSVVEQDRDALQDPVRRLSGVSPSYADGVLVCPTSNRSVVAVDPATRSLLWGYLYKRPDGSEANSPAGGFGLGPPVMDPEPSTRWADSPVVLAEGRVLVTPADSAEIHCLNLIDGKLRWRKPRQDALFLACVYQGKVILAGRRSVWAIQLADGAPAWDGRTVPFPSGSSPSGTGFASGDRYLLPLSSAEVMVIDMGTGRATHSYKSRRGVVPGNLVGSGGLIVSQRAAAVDAFHQLDALRKEVDRRLAAAPNDPEALIERGEILWDEGKLKEAVASFRRALELSPSQNARNLLRDALFEGLRTEFAAYRGYGEEVRRQVDDSRQEATYLRLMAAGYQAAKDYHSAWQTYAKLMDLDGQAGDLEPLDKSHSVRRDRWIRVQLQSLYAEAPAEVRAEIDKLSQARLKAAADDSRADALRRLLDYLGGLPVADEARRQWVPKLRQEKRLLEAELVLRRLERTGDRGRAGAALAELAAMLQDEGFPEDAAACYARLEREFADVVCRSGKTGRQLFEGLASDSPVRRFLGPAEVWPTGAAVFERSLQRERSLLAYGTYAIPPIDAESPFFADVTLEVQVQENPPLLVARDGWGKVRWQVQIGDRAAQGNFPFTPAFLRAAVRDHLVVLWTGTRLIAIDTLAAGRGSTPRILWPPAAELGDSRKPVRGRRRGAVAQLAVPGRIDLLADFGPGNRRLMAANVPVVINDELVCYQRVHELCGVDPMSGRELWVRRDARPDSIVFGDEKYIFVLPYDQTTATVLRAADGKLLDTRPIPHERLPNFAFGRNVLVWRDGSLELYDPWEKRPVWPAMKFAADARVTVVDRESAAVFEPRTGRFTLVRVPDGRKIIDAGLRPERFFADLHVFRSADRTMLVINGLERTRPRDFQAFGLQGVQNVQIGRAHVYGFDRQGKKAWDEPVTVEDQFLPTNQPARLPVLVFARGVPSRNPNFPTQKITILCIDKRTGRVLGPETLSGLSYLRLAGDPEKKTVEFRSQQQVVTLKLTDKPVPPPKTGEMLWKAFWKGIGAEEPPIPWRGFGDEKPPTGKKPAAKDPNSLPKAPAGKPEPKPEPPKTNATGAKETKR